jgi:diguanylate cyclase (GGDEF)-like protein
MEISRVAPPTVRRIAVVWSLDRLTGRPMRPSSAIADLLFAGLAPLVRGGWSIAGHTSPNRAITLRPDHRALPVGTFGGTDRAALDRSLQRVMRPIVTVVLAALVIGAIALVIAPGTFPWLDAIERSFLIAVAGALIGATFSALVLFGLVRFRLGRLVKAAERIAAGDYTIAVRQGGGSIESRLARAINRTAEAMADTHDRATIDRLTNVFNRQALLSELFTEVERAARYDRPLCVAFVDIDHFKLVNDNYGHESGDLVLRGVARILAGNLRTSDIIGRYGGEEFMLILTETNVEEGTILSEKLRTLVERETFAVEGNEKLSVTISIGIVGGVGQQLRMETLVRDADAAMYSAKSLGRNQTYIFAEPDDDARVPRAPISATGRVRALEIGRQAREAAIDYLTAVVAPLPSYRGQPSAVIASIVVSMARSLELPEQEIDRIRVAALLHDVGKVAIPDEILDKPSELTSAEWRSVVQHPRIGQVILEQAAALKDSVPIILHHHERYAGHGYPFGLRAAEIPLGARIVAIADAYDAMTNDRPYKRAVSHGEAIAELRRHAGTQFDPELVALFCDLFATTAPAPDPAVLAMIQPHRAGERRAPSSGGSAAGRRSHAAASVSSPGTMGPDSGITVELGTPDATSRPAPEGRGRRVAG